jgi:inner centromere protein
MTNYNIDDLNSGDETDDEDEPNKPVPEWAKGSLILERVIKQQKNCINFTQLFKASSQYDIQLDQIFKIPRTRFYHRSSSAIWNSPPVWRTGLKSEDYFLETYQSSF